MAEVIGTASQATASFVTKEYPVANGVTVNDGDVVYFASGRVTNATIAGATVLGVVQGSNANDPSNVTNTLGTAGPTVGNAAGTATVLVIVDPSAKILSNTSAAATVGSRYNLSGATGAQVVNTGAGGTQVECIKVRSATQAEFIFQKHEYKISA